MKKILCPTDFSENALNAIAYAAKFAQVTDSELVLFNVQSLFALSPVEILRGKSETVEQVKNQLEALCHQVATAFKISCYSEVQVAGAPLTSVISANAADFDLIIMGTNGPDDLYQFFTGSNAYNVIRKAAVPVLLVPWDCGYRDISLVIYAFDYLRDAKLPLDQLAGWIKPMRCELRVLEVLEESISKKVDSELRGLQALIKNVSPDELTLKFDSIHSADIIESINTYVLRNDGDMLALCTHDYPFLEKVFHKSVIKAITIMARYPVFVFHH
jgi:nucleotide-binding universal stress UspA family protein